MYPARLLLSREAQRFRNLGFARYEARELARRFESAQSEIDKQNWEKAKVFKDPAEQLWIPFLILACIPLAAAFASIPADLNRLRRFLTSSSQLTSVIMYEDLKTERAIQEHRDSVDKHDADAFTKPELWGQQ
jgi:hypothetical protein